MRHLRRIRWRYSWHNLRVARERERRIVVSVYKWLFAYNLGRLDLTRSILDEMSLVHFVMPFLAYIVDGFESKRRAVKTNRPG